MTLFSLLATVKVDSGLSLSPSAIVLCDGNVRADVAYGIRPWARPYTHRVPGVQMFDYTIDEISNFSSGCFNVSTGTRSLEGTKRTVL